MSLDSAAVEEYVSSRSSEEYKVRSAVEEYASSTYVRKNYLYQPGHSNSQSNGAENTCIIALQSELSQLTALW